MFPRGGTGCHLREAIPRDSAPELVEGDGGDSSLPENPRPLPLLVNVTFRSCPGFIPRAFVSTATPPASARGVWQLVHGLAESVVLRAAMRMLIL